jgi:hypothetical protein
MLVKSTFLAMALIAMSGGIAAANTSTPAASTSAAECFANNPVTKVVPHHASVLAGQGTHEQLVGARAYVPAKPGLTGEWLHAQLARRASAPQGGTSCPLDVPGLDISVRSAGPGFWVSLSAPDASGAREVLRRAQTLTR